MDKKKIRALLFLAVGAGLIWFVYRDMELSELKTQLPRIGWGWVAASLVFNLSSQLIKTWRWRLLILPLGHRPGLANLYLSNLVLAFTNLVIPRGGEIARLGVVTRFEGIPLVRLLGTALVERLTDLVVLLLLTIVLLAWQWERFVQLVHSSGLGSGSGNLGKTMLIIAIALAILVLAYLILQHTGLRQQINHRLKKAATDLGKGWRTFGKVRRKGLYIFLSLTQYGFWLAMLYVIFLAFPPTEGLSLGVAAFTFGLSTLAFLIPVQAGIGAWHFMVIQALLLFGIAETDGRIFALIAHSFTQLIHLVTGGVAFLLLPVINSREKTT